MRQIEPYQIKKIYAIGSRLGITSAGRDDDLHAMVQGMTGKGSIRALTYKEASAVIARLAELQGGQAPPSRKRAHGHPSRPGGVTSGQQKKIWALMYELQKHDEVPNHTPLGDRLCAVIKKELGTDAIARTPFAWLDFEQGSQLIEALKKYVENTRKKRGCGDGLTG